MLESRKVTTKLTLSCIIKIFTTFLDVSTFSVVLTLNNYSLENSNRTKQNFCSCFSNKLTLSTKFYLKPRTILWSKKCIKYSNGYFDNY